MTVTIEQRLQELLDQKDQLLVEKDQALEIAENRINTLEREQKFGVDWMLQRRGLRDGSSKLALPRLEMTVTCNEHCYQESEVCLVLGQRDGTLSRVPLSFSKRSGGSLDISAFPTKGALEDFQINQLSGVLHDACFYSDKTGIPAFVVLSEDRQYRITSLRPLKLESILD